MKTMKKPIKKKLGLNNLSVGSLNHNELSHLRGGDPVVVITIGGIIIRNVVSVGAQAYSYYLEQKRAEEERKRMEDQPQHASMEIE